MSADPADIHVADCKSQLVMRQRDCTVALHALNADFGRGRWRFPRYPNDFLATNALPLM